MPTLIGSSKVSQGYSPAFEYAVRVHALRDDVLLKVHDICEKLN
ncbi:MAG TPA: hypothetical protein VJW20_18100 [Candidatus Angelobacter sp.]|nr:hypothetical protein [Candidatus Angelobacter sp.]